ncbi:RsmD family RNA methyltransferase [Candidatus Woesearchaeota archaeon]|nr:RsmD family RNA methyltransferase [Candidatus Woesearchaeota archaeon]
MTKKELAITLSKLELFSSPDVRAEQYPTDSEIAAEILWQAYMNGNIEEKTIADLGAGTGILGIGCLLLGAKKVFFVEKDRKAVEVLVKNLAGTGCENFEIVNEDIQTFNQKVDVVVQNPPFGTKEKHADINFLDKAMQLAPIIYTFHKTETKDFIYSHVEKAGFKTSQYWELDFPLKKTMKQHRKKLERIRVSCFRIVKFIKE